MKHFLLLLLSAACLAASAQKKLALIVAVGNYLPSSKISPIASLNDIKYIKAVLKNNGFADGAIDTLTDARATKAGILKALDNVAVRAARGDVVLLHFSMHGQQIRDQKEAGKDEDDGLDEALVPYDVKKPQYYPGVYTGEAHLRDDDLAPKLSAIRNKLGPAGSLLVLIDACHSGTATRAATFTASRGEPVPFYDPQNPMESTVNLPLKDQFLDALADSASNMVVISGSGPHQQNFQTEVTVGGKKEQVGSLSYGFYKAMSTLGKDADYALLFQKIKAFVQAEHPAQLPMVEGNTAQQVFSGRYNPVAETIVLTAISKTSATDTAFRINKGLMDGLGEGATVKIFVAGTAVLYAEGIVKKAEHFTAYGVASVPLKKGEAYEARTVTTGYQPFSATVKIQSGGKGKEAVALEQQLKQLLKPYPFIVVGSPATLLLNLESTATGHRLQLIDATDSTRWQKALPKETLITAADVADVAAAVKASIRVKYLRTLPDGGNLALNGSAEIITTVPAVQGAEVTLAAGDAFAIKIKNSGNDKLFYTILDITPDNNVTVLYPTKNREPADYGLEKMSEVVRKLAVSSGTPSGREFFKIILSREPLDLRSVLEHRKSRAEMTSFQTALDDLFTDGGNTGTRAIGGIKADETGIITVSITVKAE